MPHVLGIYKKHLTFEITLALLLLTHLPLNIAFLGPSFIHFENTCVIKIPNYILYSKYSFLKYLNNKLFATLRRAIRHMWRFTIKLDNPGLRVTFALIKYVVDDIFCFVSISKLKLRRNFTPCLVNTEVVSSTCCIEMGTGGGGRYLRQRDT